jgi:hypothetical protein
VRVGVTVLTSVPELPSAHEALRGGNRRAIRTRSRSHSQWDCYHSTDSAKLTRNRGCGLAVLTLADQRRQRRVRHSPIRKSGAFRTGTLRASRSTQPLQLSSSPYEALIWKIIGRPTATRPMSSRSSIARRSTQCLWSSNGCKGATGAVPADVPGT